MEKKQPKWILEDERGKRPGQKFKSLLVVCLREHACKSA